MSLQSCVLKGVNIGRLGEMCTQHVQASWSLFGSIIPARCWSNAYQLLPRLVYHHPSPLPDIPVDSSISGIGKGQIKKTMNFSFPLKWTRVAIMENMEYSFNSCNSNEPKQFVPHHGEFVNERMINIKFGGISRTSTRQLKFVYEFCHAACQLNFILNTEANINMYPPYSRFISEIIIKTGEFVENTYKIETIYIYMCIFFFFSFRT